VVVVRSPPSHITIPLFLTEQERVCVCAYIYNRNKLSEGQRRRVQLFLGLLVPSEVILLDEVTSLLDVVSRGDLLQYLRKESEQRNCTVVIATHVFDGLDNWATRLVHLRSAPRAMAGTIAFDAPPPPGVPLFVTVEQRLRAEQELKRKEESQEDEAEAGEDALIERSARAATLQGAGGYAPGRSALMRTILPRSMEPYGTHF